MKLLHLPPWRYALLCVAMGLPFGAFAGNSAMDDLLKVLRDKGAITSSEYKTLKKSVDADRERSAAENAKIKQEVTEATRDTVKVKTGSSGLKVESAVWLSPFSVLAGSTHY